jgi:hypothetical protein
LAEARRRHPEEWERVQRDIERMVRRDDPEEIMKYLRVMARPPRQAPDRARPREVVRSEAIRRYLMIESLRQASVATEAGVRVGSGRLRLSLWDGWIAQRLLFRRGLERKPVSLGAYRLFWPLVRRKGALMPLVRERGIYCFYSRRLVREIAGLVAGRPCVEIAAGDGTLTRFLRSEQVDVVATDDHSWDSVVDYPQDVLPESASRTLNRLRPGVVICSWPPPGNTFEKAVFETPSVELYIVIGSRHETAAGDWNTYRSQTSFDLTTDDRLSRLILPGENSGAVHVFRRRTP